MVYHAHGAAAYNTSKIEGRRLKLFENEILFFA